MIGVSLLLVLTGVAIYALLRSRGSSGDGGRLETGGHTVRYEVTNATDARRISYQDGSQDMSEASGASLPWTDTETMSGGDFYYVSAQNDGGGVITCSVYVDGALVYQNNANGRYAICQASGSI